MRYDVQNQAPRRQTRRKEDIRVLKAEWRARAADQCNAACNPPTMRIDATVEGCAQDPERWDSLQ
jgi:hypothetical protein